MNESMSDLMAKQKELRAKLSGQKPYSEEFKKYQQELNLIELQIAKLYSGLKNITV